MLNISSCISSEISLQKVDVSTGRIYLPSYFRCTIDIGFSKSGLSIFYRDTVLSLFLRNQNSFKYHILDSACSNSPLGDVFEYLVSKVLDFGHKKKFGPSNSRIILGIKLLV